MPSLEDLIKIIGFILTAPPLIYGFIEGSGKLNNWLLDRRKTKEILKKPPDEQQFFEVKTTHIKYVMQENSTEMTKVRTLRAFRDVQRILLDKCPRIYTEISGPEQAAAFSPDFFAIPGVALQRGAYFLIDLAGDQIFKAHRDHTYVLNYEIPQKLDEIHDNPRKEAFCALRPLGTEKLVVELHFPPTRRIERENNNKVKLEVFLSDSSTTPLKRDEQYQVHDEDPIHSFDKGNRADRFRLTLLNPPRDADLEIKWYWHKK